MNEIARFGMSATRLPMDHFVSGALLAGIGAGAYELNEYLNHRTSPQTALKKVAKITLTGGFVAAVAISASNSFAKGDYTTGIAKTALGIGGVLLAEKLINLESK